MKITLKMLAEEKACEPGVDWFIEHFGRDGSPDHTEILQKLYEQKHTDVYGDWMLRSFGLSGVATYWYRNNVKMCETQFVNGKEHGIETYWHDNGDFDECFYFINEVEVTKEEWEEYEENQK
jgi:antitoxin component YwqK of YwqJK toxin-antitoxin module